MATTYSWLTPELQNTVNSAYNNFTIQNQQGSGNQNQIPITGNKVPTLGGSSERPFDVIDTNFKTIYNDLFRFRKIDRDPSLGASDKLFYALDQPGHYYFKIFFYFSNPYGDPSNPLASNLLGTVYKDEMDGDSLGKSDSTNTALKYLYNNMEYTRFNYLAEFIQLLSDISTKSPWYFQSITGLDQAIERTEVGNDFKLEDERKQITIKCLPDAYDNRIGRLLDLYRTIVYSQNLHKWILPANLRKFDMGIYIFNSPIKTIAGGRFGIAGNVSERLLQTSFQEYYGNGTSDSRASVDSISSEQMYAEPMDIMSTGSKYIELRGCEIDYNSSKSVYAELDNSEGRPMEYEIIIKYDSAVEDRYDPIFNTYIGDFVIEDLLMENNGTSELNTENPYSGIRDTDQYISGAVGDPYGANRQNTILESAMGMGVGYLNTLVGKVLMGNIYGFSFGKLDSILTADPMSMIMGAGKEIKNASLIAKRISDFVDPGRGARKLSGKNLYNGWTVTGPSENISGKSFRSPEDHEDVDDDLTGKSLRSPDTDKQDEEWDLTGKSFRRPETDNPTDYPGEDWDLTGKNFREGWEPTPENLDGKNFREGWEPTPENLDGKNFREGWEPTPENLDGKNFREGWEPTPEDISGKSLNSPETDYPGEDWDLSGKNFYQS